MSAQSAIFNPTNTTSAATGDGFSVPRLTTTGRLAITFGTSDAGMMVYDTTLNNLFIWNGSAWESVPASGDAGANGSVQYNDNGVVSGAVNFVWDKTNSRVGIGTATPGFALDILGTSGLGIRIYESSTGNNNRLQITQSGTDSTFNSTYSAGSGAFAWQVASAELMRLNSTGLGIGTTILGGQKLAIGSSSDTSATANGFNIISNRATITTTCNGAVDAAGTTINYSWANGGQGPLIFRNAAISNVMTLDASGNLLVGKTANYGTGETQTLQLKSSVIFGSDNTGSASNRNWSIGTNSIAAGSMEWTISSTNTGWPNFAYRMQITSAGDVNNTTGTYGTISDLRLKENISDARNYLADLLKLRVVKYSLKEEASAVATKLGFIAQEVEQVFPNLVDQSDKEYEGAEGIRSVKTSILIPMLLKAIQELTARVQTLETR